jgi:hypothetical protein
MTFHRTAPRASTVFTRRLAVIGAGPAVERQPGNHSSRRLSVFGSAYSLVLFVHVLAALALTGSSVSASFARNAICDIQPAIVTWLILPGSLPNDAGVQRTPRATR